MESILIISSDAAMRDSLASAAGEIGKITVSDGKNAREAAAKGSYGLVIINTPLAEEFGLELASFISKSTGSAVIILASKKNCAEINRKLGGILALVLARPLNAQMLVQSALFALSAREKNAALRKENEELRKKLQDMKHIDRAKCALIQYLRVSEEDAHRMIQKRAMDERVSEVKIAMDILKTYEP